MKRSLICATLAAGAISVVGLAGTIVAAGLDNDFGAFIAEQLRAHSQELFGIRAPLEESALGPYDGSDNLQAIQVAPGLHVSLVSSSTASAADQIALWPDDNHPTHLLVCDEETAEYLAENIARFLIDDGLRTRMAAEGRRSYEERFARMKIKTLWLSALETSQ